MAILYGFRLRAPIRLVTSTASEHHVAPRLITVPPLDGLLLLHDSVNK